MIALTRILVPTNLGAPSRAAITYGVALARQFGAQLFLLHILPPREFDVTVERERVIETLLPGGAGDGDPDDLVRLAARENLRQLLSEDEERDARVEYVLRAAGPGGPGEGIPACARDVGAELIVMGKHRLGLVEHLLAGSVTEKVVRQAPCPVLIVQHPAHDFVLPDEVGEAGED